MCVPASVRHSFPHIAKKLYLTGFALLTESNCSFLLHVFRRKKKNYKLMSHTLHTTRLDTMSILKYNTDAHIEFYYFLPIRSIKCRKLYLQFQLKFSVKSSTYLEITYALLLKSPFGPSLNQSFGYLFAWFTAPISPSPQFGFETFCLVSCLTKASLR